MCAVEDADRWACYHQTNPKARIAHRCGECRRTIKPGERYHLMEGKLDYGNGWHRHKTCEHCDAAGEWLNWVCSGWVFDQLYYEMVEHWRDGYTSVPFGRLIAGIRWKWHDGRDPVPDREAVRAMAAQMMYDMVHPALRTAS